MGAERSALVRALVRSCMRYRWEPAWRKLRRARGGSRTARARARSQSQCCSSRRCCRCTLHALALAARVTHARALRRCAAGGGGAGAAPGAAVVQGHGAVGARGGVQVAGASLSLSRWHWPSRCQGSHVAAADALAMLLLVAMPLPLLPPLLASPRAERGFGPAAAPAGDWMGVGACSAPRL